MLTRIELLSKQTTSRQLWCERHQSFYAELKFGKRLANCPLCRQERFNAEEKREREASQRRRKKVWLDLIPKEYSGKRIDDFKPYNRKMSEIKKWIESYLQNWREISKKGKNVLFCGSYGTGKTLTAFIIATELIERYCASVRYLTFMDFMNLLKASWGKDEQKAQEASFILDMLPHVDLLIIDEIRDRYHTESENLHFKELIDKRQFNRKPTLFIGNGNLADIESEIDSRIYDRIKGKGLPAVVFSGPSYRGREG